MTTDTIDRKLQLEAELAACELSKRWLFERHYAIQDKEGNTRLMKPLKRAQLKLDATLEMCRRKRIPAWIIVFKSRKEGISSYVAAYALSEYITRGIEVMVIAHDKDSSAYILGIYKRFYEHLDRSLEDGIPQLPKPKPYKGQTNKYEIKLEDKEGLIVIDTANNENAGRGRTPHIIHGSEMAYWEKGNLTAISLFQSMARKTNTVFIAESTPNGEDSLFYPLWSAAVASSKLTFKENKDGTLAAEFEVTDRDKWNGWLPLFISVLEDEDAYAEFDSDDARDKFETTLDDDERHYNIHMGASLEYLNWRRMQIKQTCQGDVNIYKREFPASWQEALVASKRSRFPYELLDRMPIEDGIRGELFHSDSWDRKIKFRRDPGGLLLMFRDVQPKHRYVIGVDTAEGKLDDMERVGNPDATVVQVLDCDAGLEQVAVLQAQISEENIVAPLLMIAHYYNDAFVVIESNSTGKHVCIEVGKVYPSERLYHRDDWNPDKSRAQREIGHRTHVGNKNILVGGLATALQDNQLLLHHSETLKELKVYEYLKGGGTGARSGYHDDTVMALALGVIGAKVYPEMRRVNTSDIVQKWRPSTQRVQRDTACSTTGY